MLKTVTEKQKSRKPLRVRGFCRDRRAALRASLTVETALALPLVLFACAVLLMPMKIMDAHRKMQSVCEGVCADVSKYAYSLNHTSDGDEGNGTFASLAESGALGAYAAARAKDHAGDSGVSVINFLDTDFMTDGEMVTVKIDYLYKLPFSVLGLGNISQSVVSSRRAWVGADGGRHDGEAGAEAETDDEYVYVGENSKVSMTYHRSSGCSYLVHVFSGGTVGQARADGYKPCDRCARGVSSGNVWVTDGGGKYHTDKDCSSMNAYVRTVRLSEIPGYHPCVRCGGK